MHMDSFTIFLIAVVVGMTVVNSIKAWRGRDD